MNELHTDIAIIGGGLGGVAAALAAARLGRTVVLTEETDWLGGQLTSQGVPPDEHAWIEGPWSSQSYRALREGIRAYYRRHYPLTASAYADPLLNPGRGLVSRLCSEPPVAVAVLDAMLAPHIAAGHIKVLYRQTPVAAEVAGDRVTAVTVRSEVTGAETTVSAGYVLDATELGDLLELAGVEHVIGAESQDDTGEPHALPGSPNPLDQQAITWCFAVENRPGEDHTIEKPEQYDYWRNYHADFVAFPPLGLADVDPAFPDVLRTWPLFVADQGSGHDDASSSRWNFRRIRSGVLFDRPLNTDVTIVNWSLNDYYDAPLLGVSDEVRQQALKGSRELSLSLLYWLQTEAPGARGTGYPGLRLCPEAMGTDDGLAKYVYVRESRRIRSEFTVLEQHVGVEARAGLNGPAQFADSVGIGAYRIDLHPSTGGRTYVDIDSHPFQIPLGALLPQRVDNLLPANKNIGTTHITNGCYRLHPVEWAIGEAVGALAAFCLDGGHLPRAVRAEARLLADYQRLLVDLFDVPLAWPEPVRRRPLALAAETREYAEPTGVSSLTK